MSKLNLKAGRPSSNTNQSKLLSDLVDKKKMVRVNFDLEADMHKKLKIRAAERGCSISDILREKISEIE